MYKGDNEEVLKHKIVLLKPGLHMNIVPGLALMIIMGRRITEQYKSPKKKSNNENSSQEFMTGMDLMLSSCDFHKSRKTHKKKEDAIEREVEWSCDPRRDETFGFVCFCEFGAG